MDPGTLGCTWIAWPEAGHRHEFRSPRIPPYQKPAKGRGKVHELDHKLNRSSNVAAAERFLTHARNDVNALADKEKKKGGSERKAVQENTVQARSSAPFLYSHTYPTSRTPRKTNIEDIAKAAR